jgi:hypothetical protein
MATSPSSRRLSLEATVELYLRLLAGRNCSQAMLVAYRNDIGQFVS